MLHALPVVEIPGYREAVRKERTFRDSAWIDGPHLLCGVEVSPLTLRRMVWMDQAHCGMIAPWTWETDEELLNHSIMFLWMLRPKYRPPSTSRYTFLRAWWTTWRQIRFTRMVLSRRSVDDIVREVRDYLDLCFMDAPKGSSTSYVSHAGYPAYIIDAFAQGGYAASIDQIMDMPLPRMWQLWRVAMARAGLKLTNPSDELATEYLARR